MSRPGTTAPAGPAAGHGPSAWRARLPAVVLAVLGFLIATYLAAFQAGAIGDAWDPVFGDGSRRVLGWGAALPVPDAALGALGYLAEVVLGLAGGTERWQVRPRVVLAYGVVVAGMAVAAVVLVALQVVVLRTGCTLCVASAAISFAIAALAFPEVRAALDVVREPSRGRRLPSDPSLERRS
jgi:hypothetical protein